MYTKPQLLNVKKASSAIMGGGKQINGMDSQTHTNTSTVTAYRSDE